VLDEESPGTVHRGWRRLGIRKRLLITLIIHKNTE